MISQVGDRSALPVHPQRTARGHGTRAGFSAAANRLRSSRAPYCGIKCGQWRRDWRAILSDTLVYPVFQNTPTATSHSRHRHTRCRHATRDGSRHSSSRRSCMNLGGRPPPAPNAPCRDRKSAAQLAPPMTAASPATRGHAGSPPATSGDPCSGGSPVRPPAASPAAAVGARATR